MIPYGFQDIRPEDIEAVINVLKSDWLTQGPWVPRFEQAVAEYCGADYAVAVNSGTSALHIACLALGLSPGDRLWTSPNTFVASANCGLYCGATVDFVDIDPRTYNMSVDALALKLKQTEKSGTLPKVVIPVHFAGQSCEMDVINSLAKRYGFHIIEDASHAIGGQYKGKPIGNGQYSDITVFSFHPVKIITTGEGGAAFTNNPDLADRMQLFRTHGITRDPSKMTSNGQGLWYYQQIDLGYNYRMTDIQAALGISQMQRIDEFVTQRHRLAVRYDKALADLPIHLPFTHKNAYSSFHLYVIRLDTEIIKRNRREIFERLRNAGIGVNVHYIPVHTQPYYRQMGFRMGDFPASEVYYQEAMSLPLFPGLSKKQQDQIVAALRTAIE